MGDLVRFRHASAGYGSTVALEDVSMVVERGDFVGVVGPSGGGKTTLLHLAAGTVRALSGSVERERGTRIGYVPQVTSVDWSFPVTVAECILMGRTARRWTPWPTRADRSAASDLLERLGLGGLEARHIRELSGGQQQRTFIARALLDEPDLVLLDEPTSGVDLATRHEVLHVLRDLHSDGLTILLTTHDLNGVAAHLPTIALLNRRIVAAGPPAEILTRATLEATYEAPMDVLEHAGLPLVVDAPSRSLRDVV